MGVIFHVSTPLDFKQDTSERSYYFSIASEHSCEFAQRESEIGVATRVFLAYYRLP